VSKDLDTICKKCLEKNPEARYPTAEALAEDLERVIKGEPIRARRVGVIPRCGRWVKRNPVGTGLIVSLCACLVISLFLLYETRAAIARTRDDLQYQISNAMGNSDVLFVEIPSKDLATFRGERPRRPKPNALRLTYGINIEDDAVEVAQKYAHFLGDLEREMQRVLGHQVLFTLQLYKAHSWESINGARSRVDLQKLTFLTYVRVRKSDTNVEPLVVEQVEDENVIFARRSSGISNLTQVAGKRVAFAHTNSVVSFLGKVVLAQAGICAGSLQSYTNFAAPAHLALRGESFAHREVIAKVLSNEFEIGVAPAIRFEAAKGTNLVALHRYFGRPDVYVARAGLEPNLVKAFRMAMAAMKNKTVLEQTKRGMRNGFTPCTDSDFESFRKLLEKDWLFFETCERPGSNNAPTNATVAR
jgi:ABC-type phosphate/phosphonate transport system substrate-binding protein